MRALAFAIAACAAFALVGNGAVAGPYAFNGHGDYQDNGPYYYIITGNSAKLSGQTRNGDNATGGTMRYVTDDPDWGAPIDQWQKDDWFQQNAGLALTLKNSGATVYDNNGIDDPFDDHSFYSAVAQHTANAATPGLYRGYSMVNNWDWMYASYFEVSQQTTFDTIVGYFDLNSDNGLADFLTNHNIVMSLWSETTDGSLLPVNTGSFIGDVFSTATSSGTFSVSDTHVDRVFDDGVTTDNIYRVEYHLDSPLTLAAGGYYFSNSASVVPEPASIALLGSGVLGLAGFYRRRRANAA